jgi:hypothetical protein
LILREEHRINIFEKRALEKRIVPKKEKGTRGWGKLHNRNLHNLCFSPNINRLIK